MCGVGWYVSSIHRAASLLANLTTRIRSVNPPAGHPFDLIKTRLQTAAPGTYTGALDVVKKTLARDGPTGLYRGVVPPLLGVTPIFALSFWVLYSSTMGVVCEL